MTLCKVCLHQADVVLTVKLKWTGSLAKVMRKQTKPMPFCNECHQDLHNRQIEHEREYELEYHLAK